MAAFGHLVPPQARVELGEPQKEHAATVVDPSLASTSKNPSDSPNEIHILRFVFFPMPMAEVICVHPLQLM